MKILNRYTGEVLLEIASLRGADLQGAHLQDANFRGADLQDANLQGANLHLVNFNFCVGNMQEIFSLQLDTWLISFTKDILNIGCETHTIDTWFGFTDLEINEMDNSAVIWWGKWKKTLKKIIKLSLEK